MASLNAIHDRVQIEPLKQWPEAYDRTPPAERESSRFENRGILQRTASDLKHELRQIDVDTVIVQVEVDPDQMRKRDGMPYKNADVDPGVVVTLEMDDGEIQTYPCDTFGSWTENLRAIALTLRDLRRISRYGVGQGSEQYRGFTALPEDVDERLGPEEAARILASTAPEARQENADGDRDLAVQMILDDQKVAGIFYREAAKRSHPDRADVKTDAHFKRVQTASHVLDQHFGREKVEAQ